MNATPANIAKPVPEKQVTGGVFVTKTWLRGNLRIYVDMHPVIVLNLVLQIVFALVVCTGMAFNQFSPSMLAGIREFQVCISAMGYIIGFGALLHLVLRNEAKRHNFGILEWAATIVMVLTAIAIAP